MTTIQVPYWLAPLLSACVLAFSIGDIVHDLIVGAFKTFWKRFLKIGGAVFAAAILFATSVNALEQHRVAQPRTIPTSAIGVLKQYRGTSVSVGGIVDESGEVCRFAQQIAYTLQSAGWIVTDYSPCNNISPGINPPLMVWYAPSGEAAARAFAKLVQSTGASATVAPNQPDAPATPAVRVMVGAKGA